MGLIGEMKERILRTFLADLLDSQKPLIGRNPYRYDRMDMDGAKELARLIKETDGLLKGFDAKTPFPKRVFAAHSESDKTADIQGIRNLQKKNAARSLHPFFIPKDRGCVPCKPCAGGVDLCRRRGRRRKATGKGQPEIRGDDGSHL